MNLELDSMAIDGASPIIPGEGAASIKLGETVEDVLRRTIEGFVVGGEVNGGADDGVTRYHSTHVDFWAKDNLVWQIMVHEWLHG